jgi:hypothetical protein
VPALLRNAFWAYGVILALAVREVLTGVSNSVFARHIFDPTVQLEVWRSLIFILMIVRYYMGVNLYFDEVYFDPAGRTRFQKTSYPIDFISGLVLFLIFFVAAVTLTHHDLILKVFPAFLFDLILIKLYSMIWFGAARLSKLDTAVRVGQWMNYNNACVVVTCLVYFLLIGLEWPPVRAELITLFFILMFSVYDLKQVIATYEGRV